MNSKAVQSSIFDFGIVCLAGSYLFCLELTVQQIELCLVCFADFSSLLSIFCSSSSWIVKYMKIDDYKIM